MPTLKNKTLQIQYVKTIGIVNTASTGRGFASPVDCIINEDGHLLVLNRWTPFIRVSVYDQNEEHLYDIGSHGDGDGQFRLPTSLALDNQKRVYIADEYHHRINVFESSGVFLNNWGIFGSDDGELKGPSGLAIDHKNNIFVADQNNHRIQVFNCNGSYLYQWGTHGNREGEFNQPWGITIDVNGYVYVADWRNDRIQKFTSSGTFLGCFGESGMGDGEFNRPSSVAADDEGNMYIADWGNERIQILAPNGQFLMKLRGESTLSKWAKEYMENTPEEKIERDKSNLFPKLPPHLNTPYLISSQTEPYFWGPVSVKLDSSGFLYVTETPRHRIQVYQINIK